MFVKLKNLWEEHGFEILVGIAVLIMIIYGITRIGKKGTWSRSYYYAGGQKEKRRPPQESKGEAECRRIIQQIFNKPFPKARPDILNNPVTGGNHNLELDCYNATLRLAVEYNGVQHYKYVPYFHKNKEAFLNQKYRDELKRRMCRDNSITLIEVPYTVKVPDIRSFLIKKLSSVGYLS
uniref:DUF559 domain-containing protein n=1 Tax=viral metagenome TaxID=1070528 RepID=A0A6C0ELC6_9ZZZZ